MCIAALTLALYVYLFGAYVVRGQFSWLTLPVLLLAVYCADAASGIAHFVVDYTPNVSDVGLKDLYDYKGDKGSADYVEKRRIAMRKISGFQEVVFDFKVHHLTPRALGRRSVLKMTLPVIVYATFPLTVLFVTLGELGWLPPDVLLFFAILVGCGTVAQYAHSCTHKRKIPPVARFLQATRLFLRPSAHEVHHQFPDRQFCLLNGWANPLIDRVFHFVLSRGYLSREGLKVV